MRQSMRAARGLRERGRLQHCELACPYGLRTPTVAEKKKDAARLTSPLMDWNPCLCMLKLPLSLFALCCLEALPLGW